MPDFAFRPLRLDDLPRLHAWFNAPHAVRWWGDRGRSPESVVAEYTDYVTGRVPIYPFIVSHGGLGEADAAHRGLGKHLVLQFLREIVFTDSAITTCLIDPEPDNHIAIRAYEKAGFRFVRTVPDDGEGHAVYLMELTRAELFALDAIGD